MDEVKGFGDRGDDEVVLLQGEEGRRVSERGDATTKEEGDGRGWRCQGSENEP